MSIFTKIGAFLHLFEQDVINAANAALPITKEIQTILASKDAIMVEGLIPSGVVWGAAATTIINEAIPGLQAIAGLNNPGQVKGLLQRLASELTLLIHGGKHDMSFYIKAVEFVIEG